MTEENLREFLNFDPAPLNTYVQHPHLYIVQVGTAYKIGIANNPQSRISTIQVCNAEEISVILVAKLPTNDRTKGEQMEKHIHALFAEKRIRGEWFRLEPKDIEIIETYLAERAA